MNNIIGVIFKHKQTEVIRYFINYEKAVSYIINTSIYNDKNFIEVQLYLTRWNSLGSLEFDSNKPFYIYTKEMLLKE